MITKIIIIIIRLEKKRKEMKKKLMLVSLCDDSTYKNLLSCDKRKLLSFIEHWTQTTRYNNI